MAYKDLPCMVDFVRQATLSDKIALVGHSQGTSQTFMALARDGVDLGIKLSCFCALSPAVYKGPVLNKWYFKAFRTIPWMVYRLCFGHMAFVSAFGFLREYTPISVYSFYGFMVFSSMFDWGDLLWNPGYRYRNFVFVPTYVSAELLYFWLGKGGIASTGCMFDESVSSWYDPAVTPPMIIFCPGKDNLVLPGPFVNRLKTYENLKRLEVIDLPSYSHLDVLWAADVDKQVAKPMAKFIWSCIENQEKWTAVKIDEEE
jgi:pimeloyl-ACP methyl ester carboxylesterase